MKYGRVSANDILRQIVDLPQLVFEVTDDCNLKCEYCTYGEMYGGYDTRSARYMKLIDIKKLLDYLFDLWEKYEPSSLQKNLVVSFYGGEPLLNVRFIQEVISYVSSCKIQRNIVYAMTTNGLLLDKFMDDLVEKNFQLLVSLDGDEISNSYRVDKAGNSSFQKVIANIRILQKRYSDFFERNLNFNVVLHDRNSLESVVLFFKREFGKVPHWGEVNPYKVLSSQREKFCKMYKDSQKDVMVSMDYEALSKELFLKDPNIRSVWSMLKKTSGNIFVNYDDLLLNDVDDVRIPTSTCIPFFRKMFVTVNGKILPCEKIDHRFYYGCVRQDALNFSLEKVADQFNEYITKLVTQCCQCAIRYECSLCLYNIMPVDDGEFHCNCRVLEGKPCGRWRRSKEYIVKHPWLYKRLLTKVYAK